MISNGLAFGSVQPMLLLRKLMQKRIEKSVYPEESEGAENKAVGDTAAQMTANKLKLRQTKKLFLTQRELERAIEKSSRRFERHFDIY